MKTMTSPASTGPNPQTPAERADEQRRGPHIAHTALRTTSTAVVAAAFVAGAALVTAGKAFFGDYVQPLTEPIRGDGFCDQLEYDPYLRNSDGSVATRDGEKLRNPRYSFRDCHRGDNQCQNAKTLAGLANAAGDPFTEQDIAREGINAADIPLEDETSPDCIREAVRREPCSAEANAPLLKRRTVSGPFPASGPSLGFVQRSAAEIQELRASGGLAKSGSQTDGSYFVVGDDYRETCDQNMPLCEPGMRQPCYCTNSPACSSHQAPTKVEAPAVPEPEHCGNGKIEPEKGEECESETSRRRWRCTKGTDAESASCSRTCKCEKAEPLPVRDMCNDGVLQEDEACDMPSDPSLPSHQCSGGGVCTKCQCIMPPEVHHSLPTCTSYTYALLRPYATGMLQPQAVAGHDTQFRIPIEVAPGGHVTITGPPTLTCPDSGCETKTLSRDSVGRLSERNGGDNPCEGTLVLTIRGQ